ncbi:MAG: heavy metal-associated domain-containing protein [Candidatus Micrarchaeota archaeon]|nr:heavy metal-associated domain-containing protein [Candidatus Micrarchaeota archaeon]
MEKTIKIKGMHCKSCEVLLKDCISDISGAEVLGADSRKGEVVVRYNNDETLNSINETIKKEGYRVIN